jgi:hypothetical protein
VEGLKRFWTWYRQSSVLVGAPFLLYLIIYGAKSSATIVGCSLAGTWCEEQKSNGKEPVETAMDTLLQAYPGYDVTLKKGK